MRHPASRKTRRGFTLMELMVAMGVTALIVTVLVSVTSIALDAWRRGRSEVRAARQAKAALDTMARDLESMLVRSGNRYQWLFARVEPNLTGKPAIPNAAQIVFFNSATDRYEGKVGDPTKDLGGDVTATGYRLAYRDQINNKEASGTLADPSVFCLYRQLVDPKLTFDELLAKDESKGESLRTAWEARSEPKDFDPLNFLVENIYEMTVTFTIEYQENKEPNNASSPIVTKTKRLSISPSDSTGEGRITELTVSGSGLKTVPDNPTLASGRIVSVDITITVLSDFGIQMAKRRADLTTKDKLGDWVKEHGYHYTKSVMVPQS